MYSVPLVIFTMYKFYWNDSFLFLSTRIYEYMYVKSIRVSKFSLIKFKKQPLEEFQWDFFSPIKLRVGILVTAL